MSGAKLTVTLVILLLCSFSFPLLSLLFHSVCHSLSPSASLAASHKSLLPHPSRVLSAREPKGFYNARAHGMADAQARACTRMKRHPASRDGESDCPTQAVILLLGTNFTEVSRSLVLKSTQEKVQCSSFVTDNIWSQ